MYNKSIKTFCCSFWHTEGAGDMFIPPKSDTCMKELFRNETVLRYFISAVLAIPPEDIRTIHLKNTFLRRGYRKQKLGILDVLAEMNDCEKINIELQVKHYAHWDRRQLFYLSRLYTEDLKTGEDYSLLKRCVAVSILDFNLTDRKEYHHVYRLRDEQGFELSDVLEIHILELEKKLKGTGEVEEWIRFFRADSEEDLDMIGTENPGILEAIREVKAMSLSRWLRLRHEARLKQIRDENAWKTYEREEARKEGLAEGRAEGHAEGHAKGHAEGHAKGRAEGHAEGRIEGRAEGRMETLGQIIHNMIDQKMPDQDIIRLSGCSEKELEEIKKSIRQQ